MNASPPPAAQTHPASSRSSAAKIFGGLCRLLAVVVGAFTVWFTATTWNLLVSTTVADGEAVELDAGNWTVAQPSFPKANDLVITNSNGEQIDLDVAYWNEEVPRFHLPQDETLTFDSGGQDVSINQSTGFSAVICSSFSAGSSPQSSSQALRR